MAGDSWAATAADFELAAAWFVDMTPHAVGRWDEPGLGDWTVRDLVGHTSRSLITVENYLDLVRDQPEAEVVVDSAEEYFRLVSAHAAAEGIAQRGRDAGAALGPDPVEAVASLAARVIDRVRHAAPDDRVASPAGVMRLGEYLRTRTFELTVHTCDLARALGRALDGPAEPGRASLELVADLAASSGRAGPLLLLATGRGWPEGFSVL